MSQQPSKVRRSPNFTAFLITGGLVGLVVGALVGLLGGGDSRYDPLTALGFLGLIGAGLGVLVGGLAAVVLDRRR